MSDVPINVLLHAFRLSSYPLEVGRGDSRVEVPADCAPEPVVPLATGVGQLVLVALVDPP